MILMINILSYALDRATKLTVFARFVGGFEAEIKTVEEGLVTIIRNYRVIESRENRITGEDRLARAVN